MKARLAARLRTLEQYHPPKVWPPLQLASHGEPLPPALGEPCLIIVLHRPGCDDATHEGVCRVREDV